MLFENAGELALQHRTPERTYRLAWVSVADKQAEPSYNDEFRVLRSNLDMSELRERIEPFLFSNPTRRSRLWPRWTWDAGRCGGRVRLPDAPEVVSAEPGSCPRCGMKLLAQAAPGTTYVCPMHPEVTSDKPDRCPKCGMKLLPESAAGAGSDHEHHHDVGEGHEHENHRTITRSTASTTAKIITGTITISTVNPSTATTPRRESSGKTTWSTSTE